MIESQLRDIANRAANLDDYVTLHLAADEMEKLKREVRRLNNAIRHLRERTKNERSHD